MKRLLSFLLSIIMLLSLVSFCAEVFADELITVTADGCIEYFVIDGDNATTALKNALELCKDATFNRRYTIKMPSGEYIIDKNLTLTSYTTLDMTSGATIILNMPTGTNVFKNQKNIGGYDALVGFTMNGGTMKYSDDSTSTSCLIRLAHTRDIAFNNVTFWNNGYAHCVELAASRNVTFDGCSFLGVTPYQKSSGEALQIDILDGETHFPNMPPFDDTMNDSITVTNCSFKNLRRGVGTNSLFAGLYQRNIKINNNTFDNIAEAAISCTGYICTTVSNNVIKNSGMGIKFVMMKNASSLGDVCIPTIRGGINSNCNSIISSNTIDVVKTSEMPYPVAIQCYGSNVSTSLFESGDYAVNNITVSSNKINTTGVGIRLYDLVNSRVIGNTITSKSTSYQGIFLLNNSRKTSVENNSISGFYHAITSASGCTDLSIKSNAIASTSSAGIYLERTTGSIISNRISNTGESGICISGGKYTDIRKNTISSARNNGISALGSVAVARIDSNTIDKSSGHSINIEGKSTVTDIKSNKLSNASKSGVRLYNSTAKNISSNSVTKTKKDGIRLEASKATSITSNAVTSAVNGIALDASSNATTIKSNSLKSNSKYGLYFASGSKASVYNNTYSKNKSGFVYSAGGKSYKFANITTPSVSVSKKGTTATVKWKKVTGATSYVVYRSTSKNGKYTKLATISSSKLSYANKKLKKKKTYYYRVVAIKKANGVTAYSNNSSTKSIKI